MPRMTNREKALKAIDAARGPICDDCLPARAGLTSRQAANISGRELLRMNLIERAAGVCRICGGNKLVNSNGVRPASVARPSADSPVDAGASRERARASEGDTGRPWHWEGNVQSRLVAWLAANGYVIRSVAHTATRAQGEDIVAETPEGEELWVEVKGYPETSPNMQARHWFAGAILKLVLGRNENPDVRLAIALPDGFTTYANLAPRVAWLRESMPFQVFWVSENGDVRVE